MKITNDFHELKNILPQGIHTLIAARRKEPPAHIYFVAGRMLRIEMSLIVIFLTYEIVTIELLQNGMFKRAENCTSTSLYTKGLLELSVSLRHIVRQQLCDMTQDGGV